MPGRPRPQGNARLARAAALLATDPPPPRPSRRRADGKPRKQDLLLALASQRHDLRTCR